MQVNIFLSREVGIGSSSHCLFGAELISFDFSSTVVGRKLTNGAGVEGGPGVCGENDVAGMADCSLETFSEKKVANDCAIEVLFVVVEGTALAGLRCRIELTVFQSWRGLYWFSVTKLL
jgi:hypothetical protein